MRSIFLSKRWLWLSVLLLAGLSLTLSSNAWAGWRGGHGCGGYLNLSPQQVGQVFDLKHKFMNDTADLRKAMAVKRAELTALWRTAKPDVNQIKAKQKEINALRDQLQEKRLAFRMQMRQFCPKKPDGTVVGPGPGMGRGMGLRGPCW